MAFRTRWSGCPSANTHLCHRQPIDRNSLVFFFGQILEGKLEFLKQMSIKVHRLWCPSSFLLRKWGPSGGVHGSGFLVKRRLSLGEVFQPTDLVALLPALNGPFQTWCQIAVNTRLRAIYSFALFFLRLRTTLTSMVSRVVIILFGLKKSP